MIRTERKHWSQWSAADWDSVDYNAFDWESLFPEQEDVLESMKKSLKQVRIEETNDGND